MFHIYKSTKSPYFLNLPSEIIIFFQLPLKTNLFGHVVYKNWFYNFLKNFREFFRFFMIFSDFLSFLCSVLRSSSEIDPRCRDNASQCPPSRWPRPRLWTMIHISTACSSIFRSLLFNTSKISHILSRGHMHRASVLVFAQHLVYLYMRILCSLNIWSKLL